MRSVYGQGRVFLGYDCPPFITSETPKVTRKTKKKALAAHAASPANTPNPNIPVIEETYHEALIEVFGTTRIFLKTSIADNEREIIKSRSLRISLGQKQKGRKLLLQPLEFFS